MPVSREEGGNDNDKKKTALTRRISLHFQEDFKLTVKGEKREMIKADSRQNPQQHHREKEKTSEGDEGGVIQKGNNSVYFGGQM